MSLIKSYKLKNAVTIEYWVIESIYFEPENNFATAKISGYLNEEAYESDAFPVYEKTFSWTTGDQPQLSSAVLNLGYQRLNDKITAGDI